MANEPEQRASQSTGGGFTWFWTGASMKPRPGVYRVQHEPNAGWRVRKRGVDVFPQLQFATPEEATNEVRKWTRLAGLASFPLYDPKRDLRVVLVSPKRLPKERKELAIKVQVSPTLDAEIDNLAEEMGVTKGNLFLKAIRLLKMARDAKKAGKRVAIIDDTDNSEEEITGF